MHDSLFFTLLSVLLISLISLVGILTLSLKKALLKKILLFLVSFAAGALFGDAFIHLLPEAFAAIKEEASLYFLAGIMLFFILEKILRWRHCHLVDCETHPRHLAKINLVSDGLHNFIDGMMIAASYQVGVTLGLTTTLAILFHEIPQEIGDFAILLHSGFNTKKALFYNFISALMAFLGALIFLSVGNFIINLNPYLLAVTAGGFIYLAGSDLVPELHRETKPAKSLFQLVLILSGIGIMLLLKNLG